jgi:O-antigen chain-terminating methyltransferase
LVYEKGMATVSALLEQAAAMSGVLILELASRSEPLYWASAQPEDPWARVDGIAFVDEVARHKTHLSETERPLFLASNRYFIVESSIFTFESWSRDPHALAQGTHLNSRRYYFSPEIIAKHYRFNHARGKLNKANFENEIRFLQNPPPGFLTPSLIAHCKRPTSGCLVMQRLPGRLLQDLLREGVTINHRAILLSVLEQLAILEEAGLYHDDVRTWNVIVNADDGALFIDYGSISSERKDCVWPYNAFLSFFIFVHETTKRVFDSPIPLRSIAISPFGLTQPYRDWARAFWSIPVEKWSFRLMQQELKKISLVYNDEQTTQPVELWMRAIEEALQIHILNTRQLAQQVEAKAQQAEVRAQQAEVRAQQAEVRAQQAEVRAQQAAIALLAVYQSHS